MNKISKQNATVVDIDKKQKKSFAPGLYDLTELQRDANKIFGYSAKETLNIMQKLYEQHKVLTYLVQIHAIFHLILSEHFQSV